MVKRKGPRPTPAPLRLVSATHRRDRHGDEREVRRQIAAAVASFGDISIPDDLDEFARQAWRDYVEPAWWLDASREPCAIAFVSLWSRFRRDPGGFPATLHTQLRNYMQELGLTDERNRFGVGRDKTGDEFFDDEV